LRVATQKMPDVILLDMLLPKLSGPEVLKSLKSNPATMEIPVIVLTSLSRKNEEKLLHEGAAAYFEKSALHLDKSSDQLAATVETVLSDFHQQKQRQRDCEELAAARKANTLAAVTADSATEEWEIEVDAIESRSCITTTLPQLSKN